MLDLRLIRYFVAVAETENVGRAAERLHVSQSPLSRQIRLLEASLGVTLFERSRQRIHLTGAGRWLLGEARKLLAHAERLELDAAFVARGELGNVVVGFVRSAMWSSVLPAALRAFRETSPRVRVDLRNLTSQGQLEALRRGELDMGLVHKPPLEAGLTSTHLFDDPFMLAIPGDHPVAEKKRITPRDLDGQPWVTLSKELYPRTYTKLAAAFERAGFAPDMRYQAEDSSTVLGLVEAGMGLAMVQASACRAPVAGVVLRALPWFPASLSIHLVCRHGASPAATALAVAFLQCAAGAAARPVQSTRKL